jgi:hypothetical protein
MRQTSQASLRGREHVPLPPLRGCNTCPHDFHPLVLEATTRRYWCLVDNSSSTFIIPTQHCKGFTCSCDCQASIEIYLLPTTNVASGTRVQRKLHAASQCGVTTSLPSAVAWCALAVPGAAAMTWVVNALHLHGRESSLQGAKNHAYTLGLIIHNILSFART